MMVVVVNEVVFIYSDNEYDNDSDTITNIVSSKKQNNKKEKYIAPDVGRNINKCIKTTKIISKNKNCSVSSYMQNS